MNNRHIMQAFRSILSLQKSDCSSMSNREVMLSSHFQILCENLRAQVRSLDLGETIDALKALSYLGVPATSKIVQVLLQLVNKQVNELSLQQIMFLDFLVKDFSSTPLVEALKIALPIVFEAHLRLKIDEENISSLTRLLHYSCQKNLSLATTDMLIDYVMKNGCNIDFTNAKSIVRSLCDFHGTDESHRPLLHHALDIILDNVSQCSYHDFDSLLSKLVSKLSQKKNYFYHGEFVDSACKFIMENNCGLEEGVWILRKAVKFGHTNHQLLDYLAKKAEQEMFHPLKRCGTVTLFSLVGGFAQADFRPDNWSSLEPKLLENAREHLNQVELPWIKFLLDLCTIDCWPVDIFEAVFSEQFLQKYLAREYNILDYLQLLALNQAINSSQVVGSFYKWPRPPKKFLDKAIEVNGTNIESYPLKGALCKGLGNERYILDGVYSKLGHFIDHVIVLRKGGYPKALCYERSIGKRFFVEDLPLPAEHKIVAVLCIPVSSYCINTERLKGPIRLALNSLEAVGPIVVPISLLTWEQLFEQEKVPYLMQSIKQKCGFLNTSSMTC